MDSACLCQALSNLDSLLPRSFGLKRRKSLVAPKELLEVIVTVSHTDVRSKRQDVTCTNERMHEILKYILYLVSSAWDLRQLMGIGNIMASPIHPVSLQSSR
jgi:hypothetical protein